MITLLTVKSINPPCFPPFKKGGSEQASRGIFYKYKVVLENNIVVLQYLNAKNSYLAILCVLYTF
jgi:hypothetical protein